VRLVYTEMDDGPRHLMRPERWRSVSGAPFPVEDEYELGPTLAHAAYPVSWLVAFFGPARAVTSFEARVAPDDHVGPGIRAPNLSVACIEFDSGVIARLTNGQYAPVDRHFRVFGDHGVLSTPECWDFKAPVYLQRRTWVHLKAQKHPTAARLLRLGPRKLRLQRGVETRHRPQRGHPMDFARGIADVADALAHRRPSRLSAEFALHVNEIVLAIQDAASLGSTRRLTTSCGPVEPMPWA
jgi:predicted dehydrogenase